MFNTKVSIFAIFVLFATIFIFYGCKNKKNMIADESAYKIMFLHHSTGQVIWEGKNSGIKKITGIFNKSKAVPDWFENYNKTNGTNFFITEQVFPKAKPYGWNNYPFDYYNIFVKNSGDKPYLEEPTLEMLTKDYDMIIFKHCFPAGNINESSDSADINSAEKTVENYKSQYLALKEKLIQFPDTKFLIWTTAALVESQLQRQKPEEPGNL